MFFLTKIILFCWLCLYDWGHLNTKNLFLFHHFKDIICTHSLSILFCCSVWSLFYNGSLLSCKNYNSNSWIRIYCARKKIYPHCKYIVVCNNSCGFCINSNTTCVFSSRFYRDSAIKDYQRLIVVLEWLPIENIYSMYWVNAWNSIIFVYIKNAAVFLFLSHFQLLDSFFNWIPDSPCYDGNVIPFPSQTVIQARAQEKCWGRGEGWSASCHGQYHSPAHQGRGDQTCHLSKQTENKQVRSKLIKLI